ncbi:FliM/FliN family flagellar motor switch protein [Roseobacter sp. HKCCA0434]|uniref:FliM/FliN family flagellar motor switch protein n=1 Tax=Roseobacter sp. HKCCA0434 TaxID=3079297 RepID=UPI0029058A71|nr:FliM/FliN family flagellar motor switch protein [Roseobacter sp. HKCCA0434]
MPQNILARKIETRAVGRVPLPEFSEIATRFAGAIERVARDLFKTTTGAILMESEVHPLGRVMERIPIPAMLGLGRVPGTNTATLINLSSDFVYHLVDLRMGGNPQLAPTPTTRSLTAIDMELCRDFLSAAMTAFTDAMEEVTGRPAAHPLVLTSLEQNATQISIAPSGADVVAIGLNLDIGEAARNADMELLIPLSVLDGLRGTREKLPVAEDTSGIWRQHMQREAALAPIELTAALHRMKLPMAEIADWQPGDVIPFLREAVDHVELRMKVDGARSLKIADARLGAKGLAKGLRLNRGPSEQVTEHLRELIDLTEPDAGPGNCTDDDAIPFVEQSGGEPAPG